MRTAKARAVFIRPTALSRFASRAFSQRMPRLPSKATICRIRLRNTSKIFGLAPWEDFEMTARITSINVPAIRKFIKTVAAVDGIKRELIKQRSKET